LVSMATNTFFNFTCKCCSFDIISSTFLRYQKMPSHRRPLRKLKEISNTSMLPLKK
jgi:hypothetical protein